MHAGKPPRRRAVPMAPVRELSRCPELRALAGGAQCTNGNDPHATLPAAAAGVWAGKISEWLI